MKKIAQSIVRLRKLILTVAVLLLIPSAIGAVATRINYDVLTYLPQELDSMIGEVALEDDFHLASTGMITVEGLPTNELIAMKKDPRRDRAPHGRDKRGRKDLAFCLGAEIPR